MSTLPPLLRHYLTYLETIRGKSPATVEEYLLDLRTFFRFLLQRHGAVASETPLETISIESVDEHVIASVTLSDIYDFLFFLARDRSCGSRTRARKVSCLKSFFRYCTDNIHILDQSPAALLEAPKTPSSLPIYLSLEESIRLLEAVEGKHALRDYSILTVFLNCGIRLAELTGLNLSKINLQEGIIRVVGKGNKERLLYLNEACLDALQAYLEVRPTEGVRVEDRDAVFLSGQNRRINRSTVQKMVENTLKRAGLENRHFSTHKLRHTAATLMFAQGVDVRTLQDVLGHEQLNTTQIYTHVSDSQLRQATEKNPLADIKRGHRARRTQPKESIPKDPEVHDE